MDQWVTAPAAATDPVDPHRLGWCCPSLATSTLSAQEAITAATVFKALAHPHRVQLVNLLARSAQPVCVCDLTAMLGLAQSTVSHHLKLLVGAGLLCREQRGIWAYYSVDREAMRRLGSVVSLDQPRRDTGRAVANPSLVAPARA